MRFVFYRNINMVSKCAVLSCNSYNNDKLLNFFHIPRNPERRKTWLKSINRRDLEFRKLDSYVVCSRHFEKRYLFGGGGKARLVPGAVPTLCLNVPGQEHVDVEEVITSHQITSREPEIIFNALPTSVLNTSFQGHKKEVSFQVTFQEPVEKQNNGAVTEQQSNDNDPLQADTSSGNGHREKDLVIPTNTRLVPSNNKSDNIELKQNSTPEYDIDSVDLTGPNMEKKSEDYHTDINVSVNAAKMILEEDFGSICRICLKKCIHMRLITHVEDKVPGKLPLIELIKRCASVKVEEGDGLPQQVCVKCILQMKKRLLLEQLIIHSDAALRGVLKSKQLHRTKVNTNVVNTYLIGVPYVIGMPHMEQNKIILIPTQPVNNILRVDNAKTDTNTGDGVDDVCMENEKDHAYCINDASETEKKEQQTYYCRYCARTFVTNRLFHLHFSQTHPNKCSQTYLKNLFHCEKEAKDTYSSIPQVVEEIPELIIAQKTLEIQNANQLQPEVQPKDISSLKEQIVEKNTLGAQNQKLQSKDHPASTGMVEDNHQISTTRSTPETQCNNKEPKNFGFLDIWKQIQKEASSKRKQYKKKRRRKISPEPEEQNSNENKTTRKQKPKSCNICGKKLTSSLQTHMRIHTGERPNMCHICGRTFIQLSGLRLHQATHSNVKNLVCEVCGKRFACRQNLRVHMETHMSPTLKCPQCPTTFTTNKKLDVHFRSHHNGELFKCPFDECKSFPGYTLKRNLNVHIQLQHADADTVEPHLPYHCTLCPRSFSQQYHLDIHIKAHLRDISKDEDRIVKPRVVKCPVVHRRRYEVKNNIRILEHLECKECGKVFKTRVALRAHSVRHGESRPFACDCCNRNFSSEEKLKAHIEFKRKPKRHECPTCHKRFQDKSALRVHNRTHTGEKPFECSICQRRFTVKRALETHLNLHNKIFPYDCKFCDKKYPNRSWLNTHMLMTHNFG